jgi:hypothetical protein
MEGVGTFHYSSTESKKPMIFKIGQKVICIDDGDIDAIGEVWRPGEEIHEGKIYTVSAIVSHRSLGQMVSLVEVERSTECWLLWGHKGYGAIRFRPIVERQTDIFVFTEMLKESRGQDCDRANSGRHCRSSTVMHASLSSSAGTAPMTFPSRDENSVSHEPIFVSVG